MKGATQESQGLSGGKGGEESVDKILYCGFHGKEQAWRAEQA